MPCGNSNWFVRNMPTQDSLRANRFLSPFANRILAPELWRFTRRSVPRGVDLGILIAIIVPFPQVPVAALLPLSCRANVHVAALPTFIPTPLHNQIVLFIHYTDDIWLL